MMVGPIDFFQLLEGIWYQPFFLVNEHDGCFSSILFNIGFHAESIRDILELTVNGHGIIHLGYDSIVSISCI